MKKTDDILGALKKLSKTDKGITIVLSKEDKKFISYRELWNRSFYVSEIFKKQGVSRNAEVIIRCENLELFLYSFWACAIGGYIAVPIDASKNSNVDSLLTHVLEKSVHPIIVSDSEQDKDKGKVLCLQDFYTEILKCPNNLNVEYQTSPEDILYILYSSGTTGTPKGVMISKSNVAANVYGFVKHYAIDENDKFLSWTPLTHCYGLVIFHLVPLMAGADQCLLSTKLYMNQPLIWAETINEYRATRIGSLPFALKHFNNVYMNSEKNFKWDLSCVDSMFLGGESVSQALYKEFCNEVNAYGFSIDKVYPLYGLTEATIMLTANRLGKHARTFEITNDKLVIGDKVQCRELADGETADNVFLEMGTPLETVQLSIRDDNFQELPEGHLGQICASGPCITAGYYQDSEATDKVFFEEKWLCTGDIGFIQDNNLIIIGREKELVVANGKKVSCAQIEELINNHLHNTKHQQCAVCNGTKQENDNEKVIVFIKTQMDFENNKDIEEFKDFKNNIISMVFEKMGLTISEVVPVEDIPKTNSGKAFRRGLTEKYNAGTYETILNNLNYSKKSQMVNTEKTRYSRNSIAKKIVTYIESRFDVKVLAHDIPFSEYGIVSINIPSFIENLNKEFNVNILVADIFKYFTIYDLSEHIYSLVNLEEKQRSLGNMNEEQHMQDKIAIVGMSCRFPGGANSIDEYWNLLVNGVDGVCDVPENRWEIEKYYDEDKTVPGKMYCKKGGFLNINIDEFDAGFFNISPKEAAALDPQQRMLLELTWEAFENANMDITKYNGSNTGVYVGMSNNEYNLAQLYSGELSTIGAYALTGSCMSTACGRVSYTFGFEGPCITVDTACSSTLSALHLACTAMQAGEADMQIVAGVNLMESPTTNIGFSKLQATSVDGHSKAFDEAANGYGRGEGGGVLILKKLSDAIKDQDEILGIIRGTGINQDGKSNGLTAPNGEAQEKLIEKTLMHASMDPHDVDFVEMHGTGTKLGDPIEVHAVGATYGKNRNKNNLLKIGSVKSNIGHLEAAAGVASIIKVLLSMKHNMIPANLHFHTPNPFIDWEGANVEVISEHASWKKEDGLRAAAINGFGFGGSNAHTIIEEYKNEDFGNNETNIQDGIDYILKISAKSKKSLNELIEQYYNLIANSSDNELEDIIYTANLGRADLEYRFAVCGSNRKMIAERLESYLKDGYAEGVFENIDKHQLMQKDRKVVFMFTGQGSQYLNMGKLLYDSNAVFKQAFDTCDRLFKPYLLKSIADLIYGENADEQVIEKTVYAQPLIFAVEYALYKLWESYGVKPEVVMGHSIGEYPAAVVAGIMTLEDAIKLVSIRGRLMDAAPGKGKMATVFADKAKVQKLLTGFQETVCIAAHNAEETCVISGMAEDIEKVVEKAKMEGMRVQELKVSHAFHSMLMEPILDDFHLIAKELDYKESKVKFVSSLYAKELEEGQILDGDYWTSHIREKVDFFGAVTSIDKKENYLLLEVGSNRVLAALCKLIFEDERVIASTLNMKKEDKVQLANEIALLYVTGVDVDWSNITFAGKTNWNKVKLPNYPYEKNKYWMDLKYDRASESINAEDYHNILGQRIDLPSMSDAVVFQRKFTALEPYFMREHVIFKTAISPAAAHMAMILSAVKEIGNAKSCVLSKVDFRVPLAATDDEEKQVQICLEKEDNDYKFNIVSRDFNSKYDKWLMHAKGNVCMQDEYEFSEMTANMDDYKRLSYEENIENSIYYFMSKSGFELGEGFQRIKRISYGEDECVCVVEPLKTIPYFKDYVLYPGTIDSIFQTGIALVLEKLKERTNVNEDGNKTVIPYYLEKLTFNYRESDQLWCYSKSTVKNDITYADVIVYNEKGEVLMKIDNLMAKITESESLLQEMSSANKLYYHTDWVQTDAIRKLEELPVNKQYLLIADEAIAAASLKENMEKHHLNTICVLHGDEFLKKNTHDYTINQDNKEEWSKLLADVCKDSGKKNLNIIYCTTKDSVPNLANNKVNYRAIKALHYLVQVMNEEGYTQGSKIKIVTKDVQKLRHEKKLNLSGSMVWGLAKVMSIEYPEIFGGIIDTDEITFYENSDFIHEVLGDSVQEVCFRENERYVGRLIAHADYLKKGLEKNKKIVLKEEASYLITGGTGALGLAYAEQLVNAGAKNLILISRREPSEHVKVAIQKLIDKAVQVKIVHADVCNDESLIKALDDIQFTMPPIRGVVHAAGVLNDKMLIDLNWEDFEKVMNPKVVGTLNVFNAIDKETLDFFMMLSSITSVIGNMGQGNYAAANHFMNSFATYMNMNKLPGYTFCWGPWNESGMAADNDAISSTMARMGMKTFSKGQGQSIINDFMDQPYENLLIADIEWNTLVKSLETAAGKTEFLSKLVSEKDLHVDIVQDEKDNFLETIMSLSGEGQNELLIEKLQSICGKIMGFDHNQVLSIDKAFQEQGADSLMIFSMRTAINKLLGIDVNVSVFFNYPTIVKLSDYLLSEVLILENENMGELEEQSENIDDLLSEIDKLTI
ncbi:SDR family NAD(P)-dependent oxidoreductase [Lysinibacillus sphaericus]|uniref:SDR family NAD(P)-dependent oxidoreductase n=1 Tax=Lysinibacillus sphaericus TaxID=1421 RepID=UPI003804E65D